MKVYKKHTFEGYHKKYKYNMVVGDLDVYFNKKEIPQLIKLLFITGSLDGHCSIYKGKDIDCDFNWRDMNLPYYIIRMHNTHYAAFGESWSDPKLLKLLWILNKRPGMLLISLGYGRGTTELGY